MIKRFILCFYSDPTLLLLFFAEPTASPLDSTTSITSEVPYPGQDQSTRSILLQELQLSTSRRSAGIQTTTDKFDNIQDDLQNGEQHKAKMSTFQWDAKDNDNISLNSKETSTATGILELLTLPTPLTSNLTNDMTTRGFLPSSVSQKFDSTRTIPTFLTEGVNYSSYIPPIAHQQDPSKMQSYPVTPTIIPSVEDGDYKQLYLGVRVQKCTYYSCQSGESMCNCEPACLFLYGDCCYDYIEQIAKQLYRSNLTAVLKNKESVYRSLVSNETYEVETLIHNHSACVQSEAYDRAFWMISRCPNGFSEQTLISKCENGTSYGVKNIPLDGIDRNGNVRTYKNIFCAVCHGIDPEKNFLKKWKIQVFCTPGTILPAGNISLTVLPSGCYTSLSSSTMHVPLRKCSALYVADSVTCDGTADAGALKMLCGSYIHIVKENQTWYLNPHCAMCVTGIPRYNTICSKFSTDDTSNRYGGVNLMILFDFNPETGFTVQAYCQPNLDCLVFEIYDCITEKCRFLYCSDNQVPYFGTCVYKNQSNQHDHWFEETKPRDLAIASSNLQNANINVANILYVDISAVALSPMADHGVIIAYLHNLAFVEEVITIISDMKMSNLESENTGPNQQVDDTHLNRTDGVIKFDRSTAIPSTNVNTKSMWHDTDSQGNPTVGLSDYINSTAMVDMHTERPMVFGSIGEVDNSDTDTNSVDVTSPTNKGTVSSTNIHIENNNNGNHDIETERGDRFYTELPKPDNFVVQCTYSYNIQLVVKGNPATAAKQLIRSVKQYFASLSVISNITVSTRTYTNLESLHCDSGNITVELNDPFFNDNTEVMISAIKRKVEVKTIFWSLTDADIDRNVFNTVAICVSQYQIPNMNCNMTVYDNKEVYFENMTLYIKNTSLSYSRSEYVRKGKQIFVCIDKLIQMSYTIFFKYSEGQQIISRITSSVSLVGLMLICVMHIKFPKLRNRHGLNILALSITMSFINAMLLIEKVPMGELCLAYGVCLHFLVLKMFVWTNIIGVDMANTFYYNVLSKDGTSTYSRFLKYFLISFTLPLALIATCLSLDYSGITLKPGYGEEGICWITNSAAIVIFFIIPICVCMSLNLVLFSVTLHAIQSAKIKSTARTTARNKSYCLAYFKLSIILGFTWFAGVIAAFVSIEWLWHVHIILNGIQGLSLFLCTIVNARTVGAFREWNQQSKHSSTKLSQISRGQN